MMNALTYSLLVAPLTQHSTVRRTNQFRRDIWPHKRVAPAERRRSAGA